MTSVTRSLVHHYSLYKIMQKLITFIFFNIFLATTIYAQPSVIVSGGEFNPGETYIASFSTRDFTDITKMNFSVTWDATVLEFTGVNGIDPNFVNPSFYDTSNATAGGIMTLEWTTASPLGLDLPDERVLFELNFRVIGACGDHSMVSIVDEPVDIVVNRINSNTQNIGLFKEDALVGVCTLPLIVNAPTVSGEMGDRICVPVTVENFDSVVVVQMTITWDPTVLEFSGLQAFGLRNLGINNFGATEENTNNGQLAMSFENLDEGGLSVEDGRVIFEICFNLVGENGTSSSLSFNENLLPIEVIKFNYGDRNLGLINNEGRTFIRSTDGTTILAPQELAEPEEEICIPITVRDFIDIVQMESTLSWDNSVLDFVSATPTNMLPGLIINEINTASGQLNLEWQSANNQGFTLDNNTVLFDLCFKVIGERNQSSEIAFILTVFTNSEGGSFIGTSPGLIRIPAKNLELIASEVEGQPGESVCVEVKVINFESIESIEFPINWEPAIITFDSIGAFNLPFLSEEDFNTNVAEFGNISMSWLPFGTDEGVSVPDSTAIFKLYFTIDEDAVIGACEAITFEPFGANGSEPTATIKDTETNESYEATIVTTSGESCVLNPNGFTINIQTDNVDPGRNNCLDFTVFNFNEVVSAQFSVNWDNEVLAYTNFNNPNTLQGLDDNSFGVEQVANGSLIISWLSGSDNNGVTVDDNTVIFELCFDAIGDLQECSDVEVTEMPSPIEVTTVQSMGEKIKLNAENGEMCINDALIIADSTITSVSCPGDFDGEIELVVEGGVPPYSFNWSTFPPQTTNPARSLSEGTYSVTIVDANGLNTTGTFEVPLSGNAPVANAGEDTMFSCESDSLILDATGSSMGADFAYNWIPLDTGIVVENGATLMPTVQGVDTYLLIVANIQTGCSAEDEVFVGEGNSVVADGGGQAFICDGTELTLDGSNSSMGDNITYQWVVVENGNIVSGENTATPIINSPGTYELTVTDNALGCSEVDIVEVLPNENVPDADAGGDQVISCNQSLAILEGSANPPGNYRFFWTTEDGIINSDTTLSTVSVGSAGTYVFGVVDLQTNCMGLDTVEVTGDDTVPEAFAGADRDFNCNDETIIINDSAPSGDNFTYQWTANNGGVIVAGSETQLNVEVSTAGTYILEVTDTNTGCSAMDEIVIAVVENNIIATAGADVNLDCGQASVMLDGTGSTDGDEIAIEWMPADNIIDNPDNRLQPSATQAGTYILIITDAMTGCMATDTVQVIGGGGAPNVVIAEPAEFSCENTENITLDGSQSDSGVGYMYSWQVVSGVANITDADMAIASVDGPGAFQLTVTTPDGCTGTGTIEVIGSSELPSVSISPTDDLAIDCSNRTLELFGDVDTQENTFEWSTTDGNFTSTIDQLNVTIDAAGTYVLTATNIASGCMGTASVTVGTGNSNVVVSIATPEMINCNQPEIILDATASSITENTSILWNGESTPIADNNNTLQPTVNMEGNYTLVLIDTVSGCQDQQTITVLANLEMPTADAGTDQTISCGGSVTLNASNVAEANSYQWTASNGGQIDEGANTTSISVSTGGTYTLMVTNNESFCTSTDTVEVMAGEGLVPAQASSDFSNCGKNDLAITASTPPVGVTGEWMTTGDAFIEDPTSPQTIASDLMNGQNIFIWTQSTPECPNYSADTLIITISGAPVANNDARDIDENTEVLNINLLQNDVLTGISNFSVQLLNEPANGMVNNFDNGNLDYTAPIEFTGIDEFEYEICNLDCTNACDTALVLITVEKSDAFQDSIANFIPSGITPNGDGANDELVFDLLEINPEQYADRELIVFNRWGDIVYSVQPYENNWAGTTNSGEELPQGTYYFILRLDIKEGIIIKGDVTILK